MHNKSSNSRELYVDKSTNYAANGRRTRPSESAGSSRSRSAATQELVIARATISPRNPGKGTRAPYKYDRCMIVCWSYCRPLAAAASALAERTREAPDRRPPRPSSDAPTDSLFTRYRNFIPSRRRSRLLRRLTRIFSLSFSAHPIRVYRVGVSTMFARCTDAPVETNVVLRVHLVRSELRSLAGDRSDVDRSLLVIRINELATKNARTLRRAHYARLREIEFLN